MARARPQEERLSHTREPLPTRVEGLPPLPPVFDDILDRGLAELGLPRDDDTRRLIGDHARLLLAWTQAINLTAIREPADVVRLHVLDSLAAVPLLQSWETARLLDLGSGGGYPGLPLAIAAPAEALLVDSVAKKTAFIATAIEALGLVGRVSVTTGRAEALAADRRHRGRWPVVTARAVATLAELIELAFPLLQIGGRLVAWKRGPIDEELAAGRRALDALGGGAIEVRGVPVAALPGHRLVVVTKVSPTPPGYPRDPALRKRTPW